MSSHLSRPKYRADIDGLRAIAVLLVVGYHAFPGKMAGGFIGVDVFFVISGFLISSIIFESLKEGSFSFKEFYARRIRRIFPSLIVVLFSSYLVGWFVLLSSEFQQLGKHLAGSAAFISNGLLWAEAGYFDKAAETKPLLHLWSLAIEEQFYIVWPLLLWTAFKKRWSLLATSLTFLMVSFFSSWVLTGTDSVAGFFSPVSRFWELLFGAVLAKRSVTNQKPHSLLSILGIVFLMAGCFYINKETPFPSYWALLPVLGSVLILAAGPSAWLNRTVLSHSWLGWFGLISFPLYLWHWPLLSLAHIMEEGFPARTIRVVAVAVSVFLAWVTYRWVEKPIRFGREKSKTVGALAGSLGFLGMLGLITFLGSGFDFRLGSQKKALREIVSHPEQKPQGVPCEKHVREVENLSFDGLCVLSKDSPPTILVVGDSHTIQYQSAFFKKFSDESVFMLAQTSCLPFVTGELATKDCVKKIDAVVDILKNQDSIKSVYLAGHWAYLMSGGFDQFGENWRLPKILTPEAAQSFTKMALRVLEVALQSNRKVTVIKDAPDLDFDIRSCFDVRPVRLTHKMIRKDCTMSFEIFQKRNRPYEIVMHEILKSFPQIREFDPTGLFCSGDKCHATDGERPYYFNGDHLNHLGADRIIEVLKTSPLPKS